MLLLPPDGNRLTLPPLSVLSVSVTALPPELKKEVAAFMLDLPKSHKDVYDEGYVDEFIKNSVPEFQKDALRAGFERCIASN